MERLIIGSTYRHVSGRHYELLDVLNDLEGLERQVVYRDLFSRHEVHVCPYSVFAAMFPGMESGQPAESFKN